VGPAFGTAFVMAAFLYLAPPLFLLGPLALLLILSRPRAIREWFWIVVSVGAAAVAIGVSVRTPTADSTLIAAAGVFVSVSFVIASIGLRSSSPVTRGLVSVVTATAALAIWGSRLGLEMSSLDAQVEAGLRTTVPLMLGDAPASQVNAALAAIPLFVHLVPGVVAFQALVGMGLAWRWYQRIAVAPLAPEPTRFTEFRFNDHLVWGAILNLALVFVPLGSVIDRVADCALVVWVGLYATRGLAVASAAMAAWSVPGRLVIAVLAFLALPVAFGTLVTIGLGDIWLDFRRRASSRSGGSNADGSHSS
jgi:hypothetical protein